jgi:hypothetical protein
VETGAPERAGQQTPKPLTLDYVSARLRPGRHGGPGNDWWAPWAFVLWFILVAAYIGLALFLAQR